MKSPEMQRSFTQIGDAALGLLDAQLDFVKQVTRSLSGAGFPGLAGACEVPEPCWMPRAFGEVVADACPGAVAVLELTIENCDFRQRDFTVTARGDAAGRVRIAPTGLTLGPKERGSVSLSLSVPAEPRSGGRYSAVIWVLGCNDHYLHWTVATAARGGVSCHEVTVCDCPDYYHHWYDHFYCARPCFGSAKPGSIGRQPAAGEKRG